MVKNLLEQQAAQAIAPHGPFAHFGTDDDSTTPRTGEMGGIPLRKKGGDCGKYAQGEPGAVKTPTLAIEPVEDLHAPQTMLLGQGHE
jgi:hypothetical protein